VPDLFRAQSLLRAIEAEAELADAVLLKERALSRSQKEFIGLVVAAAQRNSHCFIGDHQTLGHTQGPGYFYGTLRLELAKDPQTILAYEMNGQSLPINHGAPLRLRVETQLGFTIVKYIRAIEFIEDYIHIGKGQGGLSVFQPGGSPSLGQLYNQKSVKQFANLALGVDNAFGD
jgi:hypothetical protein